jgi:hypothetical protein
MVAVPTMRGEYRRTRGSGAPAESAGHDTEGFSFGCLPARLENQAAVVYVEGVTVPTAWRSEMPRYRTTLEYETTSDETASQLVEIIRSHLTSHGLRVSLRISTLREAERPWKRVLPIGGVAAMREP